MLELRLRNRASKEYIDSVRGKVLGPADVDVLLTGSAVKVYKPNGDPLLVYLPKAIPSEINAAAYEILHTIRGDTTNRGLASGSKRVPVSHGDDAEYKRRISPRTYAKPVKSSIIGVIEGTSVAAPEHRMCRQTAWTGTHLPQWKALQPYLQVIARNFAENIPNRYAVQMREAKATQPEWVVPGTPFTTVTVNNCVDPSTECLTKRLGWTKYNELRPDDELLAYNPESHTTRWEMLTGVFINERYQGDMTLLSNSRFSALTTPDHRWPIRRLPSKALKPYSSDSVYSQAKRGDRNPNWGVRKHPEWEVRLTKDLPRNPDSGWGLVRSAPYAGPTESKYSDDFVRLVAWYITEGSLGQGGKHIGISQSTTRNPQFVSEIRNVLVGVGAQQTDRIQRSRDVSAVCIEGGCGNSIIARNMCEHHYNKWRNRNKGNYQRLPLGQFRKVGLQYIEKQANQHESMLGWTIRGSEVDDIIACAPGKDKIPTMEFLSSLTPKQARIFVDTCLAGDGTKVNGIPSIFGQMHPGRMDAYAIAAVLAGFAPSIRTSRKNSKSQGCALNKSFPYVWFGSLNHKTIYYEGTVWCPRLPSGHWVARRDGRTFITGNSYPTGCHQDDGDLETGFSCLAVIRRGTYSGGFLTFPEFRTAVNMRDGDLLLMDAHEWHGNTQLLDARGQPFDKPLPDAERVSTVCYFRTDMVSCGTFAEESKKGDIQTEAWSMNPTNLRPIKKADEKVVEKVVKKVRAKRKSTTQDRELSEKLRI